MIDHVSVAVSDLSAAMRFYEAVLGAIGYSALDIRGSTVGFGKKYSEFWLNARPDMAPLPEHPGAHVCLRVRSIELVDAFHAAALANGGSSNGPPGLRPHDGEGGYYAAFILDLDGNRVEAVTRVLIESQDETGEHWSTVGVSPNIIDASFQALMDSIIYKLVKSGAPA